jgi:hypothetical protein
VYNTDVTLCSTRLSRSDDVMPTEPP